MNIIHFSLKLLSQNIPMLVVTIVKWSNIRFVEVGGGGHRKHLIASAGTIYDIHRSLLENRLVAVTNIACIRSQKTHRGYKTVHLKLLL